MFSFPAVYQLSDKKVTFLQQRAPVITVCDAIHATATYGCSKQYLKGRNQKFAENIVQWIKQAQFTQVILLLSADASFRVDAQLVGYVFLPINPTA